jgi:hypothetical protein
MKTIKSGPVVRPKKIEYVDIIRWAENETRVN